MREKLIGLRGELIEKLARRGSLDPGFLSLLSTVGGALRAIDEAD